MAAMEVFLKAYIGWRKYVLGQEDLSIFEDEFTRKAFEKMRTKLEKASPTARPKEFDFIDHRPRMYASELHADRRECYICLRPYRDVSQSASVQGQEDPVLLPCGHILGADCLARWLDPLEKENHNNCPACRTIFFDKLPNQHTIQGIQVRLDLIDWVHEETRDTSNPGHTTLIRQMLKSSLEVSIDLAEKELDIFTLDIKTRCQDQGISVNNLSRSLYPELWKAQLVVKVQWSLLRGIQKQLVKIRMKAQMGSMIRSVSVEEIRTGVVETRNYINSVINDESGQHADARRHSAVSLALVSGGDNNDTSENRHD